jgi:hypothetical protein
MTDHTEDEVFMLSLSTLETAMSKMSTKIFIDSFIKQRIELWYLTKIREEYKDFVKHPDMLEIVCYYSRISQLTKEFGVNLEPCAGAFGAGRFGWWAVVKGVRHSATIELEPHEQLRHICRLMRDAHETVYQAAKAE